MSFEISTLRPRITSFEYHLHKIENRLSGRWLSHPDHIGLSAASAQEYDELLNLEPRPEVLAESETDGRRLAAAKFGGPIFIRRSGVYWVSVSEERSSGLSHVSFVYPDDDVKKLLHRNRISFEIGESFGQEAINIPISDYGEKLQLIQRPIANLVFENLSMEKATLRIPTPYE